MYKTRLFWGNLLFLLGIIPAMLMLNRVVPDEASAQAAVVGLLILGILIPLMAVGALFSVSAVLRLNSLSKVRNAKLDNWRGSLLIVIGWLIGGLVVFVIGFIIFALLSLL